MAEVRVLSLHTGLPASFDLIALSSRLRIVWHMWALSLLVAGLAASRAAANFSPGEALPVPRACSGYQQLSAAGCCIVNTAPFRMMVALEVPTVPGRRVCTETRGPPKHEVDKQIAAANSSKLDREHMDETQLRSHQRMLTLLTGLQETEQMLEGHL